MYLTEGFLEVRRLFHLSGAPHRSGYDRKVKKTDCSRKLKSLDGDFWRFPEGQDRAGEMIREVGGLGLGGPRGKGSPSISKGPKPPIQLLQLLKRVKKK